MIIAAPAGCGKTTLAAKYPDKVKDLESSAYQYCLDGMSCKSVCQGVFRYNLNGKLEKVFFFLNFFKNIDLTIGAKSAII